MQKQNTALHRCDLGVKQRKARLEKAGALGHSSIRSPASGLWAPQRQWGPNTLTLLVSHELPTVREARARHLEGKNEGCAHLLGLLGGLGGLPPRGPQHKPGKARSEKGRQPFRLFFSLNGTFPREETQATLPLPSYLS